MTQINNPTGGIESVSGDENPVLGGNLDLDGNEIRGSGTINITGNITNVGTINGVDIQADSAKLAGIENGATADQTKSDIDALRIDADLLDGVEASEFIRSNADDSFTGTITAISDNNNPVLKIQGTGPNFITFASDNAGTVDADSLDLVYRTGPNTLGYERSSDSTSLFTVDADDGLVSFSNNIDVSGDIIVSGLVDARDVRVDGTKLDTIETNATADQTAAEIRTLVESATDSNVFTDADHTKLDTIETSATADQTAAEIRTLVESATDSNVFTDADHTKLNGIESNATTDQTKSDIDALNINADQVDSLEASQFLRSDAADTINVGRGNVFIESHTNDDQNGAGITIRTSQNPSGGTEASGSVGSIFAVRSSGNACRFWVGQNETSTGDNKLSTTDIDMTGNITMNGNITMGGYLTKPARQISHRETSSDVTGSSSVTTLRPTFDTAILEDTNYFSYTTPSSSSTSGIKVLVAGYYKVTATITSHNDTYNNRVSCLSALRINGSFVTQRARAFGYSRHDDFITKATGVFSTVVQLSVDDCLRIECQFAKNQESHSSNASGLRISSGSEILIEFIGT